MSGFAEYEDYDGLGLAELVRQGQVSATELVEEAISRIEATNPEINAVIYPLYEQARRAAKAELPDGPFKGVPFLIKDLLAVYAGASYSCGSRFLRNYVPDYDSELVRRYKQAGLVIVGKTNTPEFGLVPYTEPALFGPTRNPWDTTRTVGGSSGGSAAAVAARYVPVANGGDGGGSIRIPASCCGVFGFKPSRGRIPTGPVLGEVWHGFVTEHVIARSVRDSAAMLDVTGGPDSGAPYFTAVPARPFLEEVGTAPGRLRIAFSTRPLMGHSMDPDCKEAVAATVKLLEEMGHSVEEAEMPVDGQEMAYNFFIMLCGEVYADLKEAANMLKRRLSREEFEPTTWALYLLGKTLKAGDFSLALRRLNEAARQIGPFFDRYDVLVTPTLSRPPFPIGELQPTEAEARFLKVIGQARAGWLFTALGLTKPLAAKSFDFIPNLPVFNVTGQPAMSVPLYWNKENLPVGVQFVGRFAEDATLFRLAGQLEQARNWADKKPPLIQQSGQLASTGSLQG